MKNHQVLLYLCFFGLVVGQKSTAQDPLKLIESGAYQQATLILERTPATSFNDFKYQGDCYYAMNNFKKAVNSYEMALSKQENTVVELRLGKIYGQMGQRQKALTLFQNTLAKDSTNEASKYYLSKTLLQLGMVNAALKHLKVLASRDSLNINYPYHIGVAYQLKKQPSKTIDAFLEAFKRDSTHLKTITQLAIEFSQLKIKDSTTLFVEKGLQLDANNKTLNRIKINQLRRGKKYYQAVKILLKHELLEKNQFYNAKMLGICYFNLDSLEQATHWFNKAKKRNTTDFKIHTYLGDINVKQKNYKKAIVNYSRATFIGVIPRDMEYLKMGMVYKEIGNQKRAIELFEEAVSEKFYNKKAHLELAITSENYFEDKKIAYEYYKRYLQNFQYDDEEATLNFVRDRIKQIKETYFLKGTVLK